MLDGVAGEERPFEGRADGVWGLTRYSAAVVVFPG